MLSSRSLIGRLAPKLDLIGLFAYSDVGDVFRHVGDFKSVTNISNLSPTQTVSNISNIDRLFKTGFQKELKIKF